MNFASLITELCYDEKDNIYLKKVIGYKYNLTVTGTNILNGLNNVQWSSLVGLSQGRIWVQIEFTH